MAGNSRIKGITVEIGGETTGLQNALKDVNKRSNALRSELKDVERLLKFDPGNVEALAQKQRLLTQQIEATTEELDTLKAAQQQVQQQFERGEITERQYRNFRREIEFTEASLRNMREELQKVNNGNPVDEVTRDLEQAQDAAKDFGGEVAGVIGGLAAGGGIAGAIEQALGASSLDTTIDISFNVPEESKQSVKDAISSVEAYGIDAEAALEGVRRQFAMNIDKTREQNSAIVKSAGAITRAFAEIDFTELIQESNEMAAAMNIGQEDALAMTNALLKMGFPPDQLDILTEYGSQLSRAGYSAEEIQGVFAAGIETDSWNIDVLMDGLKEGRIVLAEFGAGIDKSTKELLEGTDISAKQLETWGQAVSKGGEDGKNAILDVAMQLSKVEDDTKRNALGVKMFGTLWEEQGKNITDTLMNAGKWTGDLKNNQDLLNKSVAELDADPQVRLNTAISDMKTSLTPLLTDIAEFVAKIADWISENPKLTATIVAITTALAILIGIFMALMPIIVTITSLAGALGISVGAVASPVLIVIGVITALIAIGVLLYKNWDTVKERASQLGERFPILKAAFNALTAPIRAVIDMGKKLYYNWDEIMAKAGRLRDKVMNLFTGIDWKLPKVKLPHFKLSGNFDLVPPGLSVPKINVDWYKNGGVFPANSPRLVGMGDANVPEAALPLSDDVLGKLGAMIGQHVGSGNGITIQNMYVRNDDDIPRIARELYKLQKMSGRKTGVVF